jgi:hypothetical protein
MKTGKPYEEQSKTCLNREALNLSTISYSS